MKKLALFLAFALLTCLCLSGCGKYDNTAGIHDDIIKKSIRELEAHWVDWYDMVDEDEGVDRYFEIKNTRVIRMSENDFTQDIAYIVEFILYTNYYGNEIHMDASMTRGHSAVAFYRDGSIKTISGDTVAQMYHHLSMFKLGGGITDAQDVVEAVFDYGDAYNCVKELD